MAGTGAIVVVVGVAAGGACAVRRLVWPGAAGTVARLAEVVVGLSVVLGVAQAAGALGVFRAVPVLVAEVAAGVVVWGAAWRLRRGVAEVSSGSRLTERHQPGGAVPPDGSHRSAMVEAVVACVGTGVVAVQWMAHTGDALARGITHGDSLWYHLPFAARFVQTGEFGDLGELGYEAARYFPFNSQLLHSLGILGVGSDAYSPYLNLGWAALALLAAWCIGRRVGHGPLAVLAASVALSVPAMAATQPGQASSDIACAALLLAAIALLVEAEELEAAPVALAGLAAGLSLSTKVSIAVPVAVLVIGTTTVLLAAKRFQTMAIWVVSLTCTGSFWFLRNWALAGSPLPWFDLTIGPLEMPAISSEQTPPLIDTLLDGEKWEDLYVPGLSQGLGRAWPLVLLLTVGGAALAIVRGRRVERVLGVLVVGGVVGHVVTPLTGGLSFVFNLRYLTPIFLVAFVLLVRFCPGGRTGRHVLTVMLAVVLVANAMSPHRERVPAWPTGPLPWAVAALAIGLAVVAGYWWIRAHDRTPAAAGVVALAAALSVAGAWVSQRHYLAHRYAHTGLYADPIHRYFRSVRDARIAVLGNDETYPLFGPDASNLTTGVVLPAFPDETPCRNWRLTLGGRFDYIVLATFGFDIEPQPERWILADDPAVTEVISHGESVVYRIDGPLDPQACPP